MNRTSLLGAPATIALSTFTTESSLTAEQSDDFTPLVYMNTVGRLLPYQFLIPSEPLEQGKRSPLVIFLHGAGERGTDNESQLVHGRKFLASLAQKHGCYVVAPQCPNSAQWVSKPWSAASHVMPKEPSAPMSLLLELIQKVATEYPIDTNRIYVMGISMGGYGTWDLLQRCPNRFAGAIAICGGGDETKAPLLTTTAIWVFHGDQDDAVPVARSRNMIATIKEAGGSPNYTEYPGCGHAAWDLVFKDPDIAAWLMAQTRRP